MSWWRQIRLWLFIISAVIWLTILLTYGLYPLFVAKDGLTRVCGLTLGRLYHNYLQLMAYLQLPWQTPLEMTDFPSSVDGARHFADVRRLFLLDIGVFIVTVFPGVRDWRRLAREKLRWRLTLAFELGALVPVALGGLMMLNFNAVFIGFHRVFFRNDDWLFDPAVDPIINVLPPDFFAACFALALLLFEAVMLIGIWQGRRDARTTKGGCDITPQK